MFASIRSRLLLIAALVIASVYFLFPRNVTIRERGPSGVMRDTVVIRVPLKRGLDLQGGMHLALELDQSKQVSADPKRDLDLALTVLRKRSAFLEFRITDKSNALEKALPAMDRTLRGLGIKGDTTTGKPSAVEQLLGGDSAKKAAAGKTSGKAAGKDS